MHKCDLARGMENMWNQRIVELTDNRPNHGKHKYLVFICTSTV